MSVLPQGKYAQCANGYRMHYLDVGAGPVVVFLHGSGPGASGHSNFKGNYPWLVERGYRCIVPDHIGYGFSDKPADVEYPLSFFTECIRQTRKQIDANGGAAAWPGLHLIEPLGYLEFNYLVERAKAVITDSGGITEETTVLGVPCLTLRDNTERPETVDIGTNELVGTDPAKLRPHLDRLFDGRWKKGAIPDRWDGHAGQRIVEVLELLGDGR